MIKRYVVLKDGTLYDLKDYFFKVERGKCYVFTTYGGFTFEVDEVKKTSDDILDLVEVEDLVSDGGNYPHVMEVISVCKHYFRSQGSSATRSKVIAVWKKQLNGDYKMYKVNDNAKND